MDRKQVAQMIRNFRNGGCKVIKVPVGQMVPELPMAPTKYARGKVIGDIWHHLYWTDNATYYYRKV
jgi:hypothetical protein